MPRWLLTLIACPLLGAASTVLVAWGCAIAFDVDRGDLTGLGTTSQARRTWVLSIYERPAVRWIDARPVWDIESFSKGRYARVDAVLPTARYGAAATLRAEPDVDEPFEVRRIVCAAGWPALALQSERRVVGLPEDGDGPAPRLTRGPFGDAFVLPVRPLWPAFLLDTACYAAVWAVVLFVLVPVWRVADRRTLLGMAGASIVLATLATITIAWTCAVAVNVHDARFADERRAVGEGAGVRYELVFRTPGATRIYETDLDTLDPRRRRVRAGSRTRARDLRGWPWPALGSVIVAETRRDGRIVVIGAEGGLLLDVVENEILPDLEDVRSLPFRPALIGFAADWGLYALVWWIVLTIALVPRRIRRSHWVRHGRCSGCGYPLAERSSTVDGERPLALCPECGARG